MRGKHDEKFNINIAQQRECVWVSSVASMWWWSSVEACRQWRKNIEKSSWMKMRKFTCNIELDFSVCLSFLPSCFSADHHTVNSRAGWEWMRCEWAQYIKKYIEIWVDCEIWIIFYSHLMKCTRELARALVIGSERHLYLIDSIDLDRLFPSSLVNAIPFFSASVTYVAFFSPATTACSSATSAQPTPVAILSHRDLSPRSRSERHCLLESHVERERRDFVTLGRRSVLLHGAGKSETLSARGRSWGVEGCQNPSRVLI